MTHITKGANTPVPAGLLRVAVCRHKVAGTPAVDVSALLLDAAGKVRGDTDLVFRNQPAHPSGAVRHVGTGDSEKQLAEWLELDLPRVEPAVQRVLIAASCDGGTFGAVPGLAAQTVAPDGTILLHYEVTDASTETAFVLGEFYRRDGQWRFRAVGQGYDSGPAGLATDFGIVVARPAAPAGPVVNTGVSKVAGPPPGAGATPEPAPATSAPAVQAPAASEASPTPLGEDFRPWTRSGSGERVLSVKLPAGPVIVEGRHDGDGLFCVDTLDDRKQPDRLILNSALPRFRGRGLATVPADRRLRLRVQFHGDWEIAVRPLSAARTLGVGEEASGSGPEVLRYDGPAADLRARFDGGRNSELFCVHSHEPARLNDLYDYKLLVNELGRTSTTAPIPRGPLFVTVANGEGDWRLQATPIPVRDGSAAPADGVYKGRRDTTVTLVNARPGHPALLEYEIDNADDRGHEVLLLDEYGDSDGEWMNGGHHGERGSHVMFTAGQAERTLQIRRAGKWRLRLLPIEQAPLLTGPAEGTGSAVLRYEGPPTLLRLRRTTEKAGRLAAHALNHPRGQRTLIADTDTRRRPVVGPLWVAPEGSCFVRVQAGDGVGWLVEPVPLDEAPVIGGKTKRVTGRGFGVVRHTGPETEMLLTHDYDMLSNLIHLFELDETLFPVRHIGRACGPHRLPGGFLQVRGFGEWALERRR